MLVAEKYIQNLIRLIESNVVTLPMNLYVSSNYYQQLDRDRLKQTYRILLVAVPETLFVSNTLVLGKHKIVCAETGYRTPYLFEQIYEIDTTAQKLIWKKREQDIITNTETTTTIAELPLTRETVSGTPCIVIPIATHLVQFGASDNLITVEYSNNIGQCSVLTTVTNLRDYYLCDLVLYPLLSGSTYASKAVTDRKLTIDFIDNAVPLADARYIPNMYAMQNRYIHSITLEPNVYRFRDDILYMYSDIVVFYKNLDTITSFIVWFNYFNNYIAFNPDLHFVTIFKFFEREIIVQKADYKYETVSPVLNYIKTIVWPATVTQI